MSELYRFIHAEKANYPIVLLCWALHVAGSSYYAWCEGEAARRRRQAADDALAHEITVLHIASRRTYGVPRIHAELRRLGRRVNRKRVARVMRERDIRGDTRRKHHSLTRPDKKAKPAPDLIGRNFHAERPGIKLVGDITYLPTAEGLAGPTSSAGSTWPPARSSAMPWQTTTAPNSSWTPRHGPTGRTALEPGCVIHSDRGSEYTSTQFHLRIRELGLQQGCGRTWIIGIPPWIPPPSGGGGNGLLRSRAGKADSPPGRIGVHRQRPAGDW
ncbi:IS3 family transposase [Streptomyces mirabilis]|uniref:IS3 family transposase n=1 Tax=Streptomyces mirabilis TaxID=68239 RepID=UPI0034098E10